MIEWYEIAALAGVIGACIWGAVRNASTSSAREKAQGTTRQSDTPRAF